MKRILLMLTLAAASNVAMAEASQDCAAGGGSYVSGVVVKGPKFAHGEYRQGVELSHTHLKLRSDQDGQVYDVAIDNVFASGYDPEQRSVPAPVDAIGQGDRVQACGQLYDRGVGIHFVHNNCGEPPTESHPDGWLRVVGARGVPGPNLESSTRYCGLFQHHGRH
jgi:hypothetical protein